MLLIAVHLATFRFFTIQTKYAFDHEGWEVGVAALWGHYPKVLTLKTALFRHFQLRSPKLVDLKLANNLQTVSKRYHGCQGVA